MSMASHDGLFGWIHSFKINKNNPILGAASITPPPYTPIIRSPTARQIFNNWNLADTSLTIIFTLFSSLACYRMVRIRSVQKFSMGEQKRLFSKLVTYSFFLGLAFAARNSDYRLEGLVPNGLPKKEEGLVKYDYSTEVLKSSFWRLFVEPAKSD